MITFPCAKINLGLNIVRKRSDGYHELQTVFYPIKLTDTLEINAITDDLPQTPICDLKTSGISIKCNESDNLIVKAYSLIANDYNLPRLCANLCKNIPTQAGLGGGSSDAAFMIRLLNQKFKLNMDASRMMDYAIKLGADCAFFVTAVPAYATGIGEKLTPLKNIMDKLDNYYIGIVKPDIAISTKEAFSHIRSIMPKKCCGDIVNQPIETWRNELTNDFEQPLFALFPELADIKQRMYKLGAIYAQMSGSGSSIFGLFNNPINLSTEFSNIFTFCGKA